MKKPCNKCGQDIAKRWPALSRVMIKCPDCVKKKRLEYSAKLAV